MTQNETILDDLRTYGNRGITAREALDYFGIFRLAARIAELRAKGHNITTEMVQNGRVRYARYRLVK